MLGENFLEKTEEAETDWYIMC